MLKPQKFTDHLQWAADVKGSSPSTLLMVSRDLKKFLIWLSLKGLKTKRITAALAQAEIHLSK